MAQTKRRTRFTPKFTLLEQQVAHTGGYYTVRLSIQVDIRNGCERPIEARNDTSIELTMQTKNSANVREVPALSRCSDPMGAVVKSQLPASAHHIRIFAATAVNSPRFCYQYVGYSLQLGDDPRRTRRRSATVRRCRDPRRAPMNLIDARCCPNVGRQTERN